jgi:thymidylate kinase
MAAADVAIPMSAGSSLRGQARGPLVVEFVGLPGAGKSTVAARLAEAAGERASRWGSRKAIGAGEVRRSIHYPRLGLFFLRHPDELRAAVGLASNGSSWNPRRQYQVVKYLSVWSYRLALARQRGYEVIILEQGPVQDTWSLMLRGSWPSETLESSVSRMILGAGLPYALVYFEVAAEAAAARIARRPTMESRFDHLDPAEATRQLTIQGERLERLFSGIVERTGAPHQRVDANGPVENTCVAIEEFIAKAARSR